MDAPTQAQSPDGGGNDAASARKSRNSINFCSIFRRGLKRRLPTMTGRDGGAGGWGRDGNQQDYQHGCLHLTRACHATIMLSDSGKCSADAQHYAFFSASDLPFLKRQISEGGRFKESRQLGFPLPARPDENLASGDTARRRRMPGFTTVLPPIKETLADTGAAIASVTSYA